MPELSLFDISAIVLTLAAVFGYLNHRWLRLPLTIGLVVIALAVSVSVVLLDLFLDTLQFERPIKAVLEKIDFDDTLMKGMLSFLLFAGALHVDLDDLLSRKWAIGIMATAGVLLSTFIVGYAVFLLAGQVGVPIPLPWCLVFGALISPTDPVAVMGILKTIKVPQSLEAKIAGESLFNDGVGVVVFTIMVAIATSGAGGAAPITALGVAKLFLLEAVGGAVLGLATGYIAYRAMKSIDEYNLEVIITLALVMMTYSVGFALHVSGPIAVVVAGLLIGNHGSRFAMSEKTREHIETFWNLLDEILNAALFLLIGFEVIVLSISVDIAWLMAGGNSDRPVRPFCRGRHAIDRLAPAAGIHQGRRTGAGLGRVARRHFCGPGAVAAGYSGEANDPRRHLQRRHFLHRRAGPDLSQGGGALRPLIPVAANVR